MTRLSTVESIELRPPPIGGHIELTGASNATDTAASLREIPPRPIGLDEAANVVSQQLQTSQRRRVAIATFVLLGNMVQVRKLSLSFTFEPRAKFYSL